MNNDYLLSFNIEKEATEKKRTLIICFSVLFLVNYVLHNYANTDLLTLFIWILLCIVLFLKHLKFFVKYALYFLSNTLNILGVYVIENNTIYLYELGTYSSRYNSLFLITLVHCIFSIVLLLSDTYIERRLDKHKKHAKLQIGHKKIDNCIIYSFISVFLVALLYMLSKAIITPARKVQLDRFVYQATYMKGLWDILHTYTIYLFPVFVIIAFRKKFIISVPVIIMYCFYLFLIGHKFGAYLTVFAFYIPFIIQRLRLDKIKFKSLVKISVMGGIVALGLYFILYSFMSNTYGTDKQGFSTYLYDRLAQQGQMWWAVYGKEQGAGFHFDQLAVSIGSLFGINKNVINNFDYGIYKMMKLVTPYNIYLAKMDSGSRYSTSTQATFYYYFKTIGLIGFTGLLAVLVSYITNWYWREVKNSSWFGSVISGFFYTLVFSVYSQSDFNILFSKRKFLVILFFVIIRKIGLILCNRRKCQQVSD